MPSKPTLNAILSFAEQLRGKDVPTVGGRATFRVAPTADGLCYTPKSGIPRKQKRERIATILARYNDTGSLVTTDYNDITRHTSYVLGLIRAHQQYT